MKNTTVDISVIIPVYWGANQVEELSKRIIKVLSGITEKFELIFVNDTSPDASWQEIETACWNDFRIKGINLAQNAGQHPAISAGLSYSMGKWIAIMDCDLQDVPEEFPKLWKKTREGYDIILARRTQRKDRHWGQFVSWLFHQFLSLSRGMKTDPSIANYALYSRKVIDEFKARKEPNQSFSALDFIKKHSSVAVDVVHSPSGRGKSSYTLRKLFSLAFLLLFPTWQGKKRKQLYIVRKTINIFIDKYGVRLKPLTEDKIEMVRQWRNSPQIANNMVYREHITPEMQKKWFASVDNEFNFYSIIECQGKEIGLANVKNVDYTGKSCEGGIFIYDTDMLDTDIPVRASLCAHDYAFEIIGQKNISISILRENKKAIAFNTAFGYKLQSGNKDKATMQYLLTKEAYYKCRERLVGLLVDDDDTF